MAKSWAQVAKAASKRIHTRKTRNSKTFEPGIVRRAVAAEDKGATFWGAQTIRAGAGAHTLSNKHALKRERQSQQRHARARSKAIAVAKEAERVASEAMREAEEVEAHRQMGLFD